MVFFTLLFCAYLVIFCMSRATYLLRSYIWIVLLYYALFIVTIIYYSILIVRTYLSFYIFSLSYLIGKQHITLMFNIVFNFIHLVCLGMHSFWLSVVILQFERGGMSTTCTTVFQFYRNLVIWSGAPSQEDFITSHRLAVALWHVG